MSKKEETCEKFNCTLEPNHDGWHVKKGARGKIIISWLDGQWKSPDGSHGTYRYLEPFVTFDTDDEALERAKSLHPRQLWPRS